MTERPDAARLQNEFRVWLEAGDHQPLVDAEKLTMLDRLDLENAGFTWLTELKLRVNGEFKPGVEVSAADRQKTREQLQTLIVHPQMGFLKQTLPNFPYFSSHTTDGRSRMSTVVTLAEVVLGPKVEPPPAHTVAPTIPEGAGAGSRVLEHEGQIQPMPAAAGVEVGSCGGVGLNACDPCAAIQSCCATPCCRGWLPWRRFCWGGCSVSLPVPCGGCWMAPRGCQLTPTATQCSTNSVAAWPTASPALISQADILRHWANREAGPAVEFVSTTRSAGPVGSEERALADDLFRSGCQAYWDGQYQRALDRLRLAADLNQGDARIWYFMGLAQSAWGQREAATASLARAVQLHAQQPRDRAILESLQRLQGPQRAELQLALVSASGVRPVGPLQKTPSAPGGDTPLIAKAR